MKMRDSIEQKKNTRYGESEAKVCDLQLGSVTNQTGLFLNVVKTE